MEAAIANLLEPGETIVVGNKGIWGQRVNDLSERYGGESNGPSTAAELPLTSDVFVSSLGVSELEHQVQRLLIRAE